MSWTYADVMHALDALSGGADPDDPKERRRLHLVAAATELFVQLGYRRTSVSEIARRAGLAKGTVYLYAQSKADLLMQALLEEKKVALTKMKDCFDHTISARARLRRHVRASLVMVRDMPLSARLLEGDNEIVAVLAEMNQGQRARNEATGLSFLIDLLREAAPDITESVAADRARALSSLMLGAALLDDGLRYGLPLERYADLTADLLVEGALAPMQPTPPE